MGKCSCCGRSASTCFNRYIKIKREEWDDYRVPVTPWEPEGYLPVL